MKQFMLITLILCSPVFSVGQDSTPAISEGSSYTITITSEDSTKPSIEFSGVYSCSGPSLEPKLFEVTEQTPYEVNVPGTIFLGLFHSPLREDRVHVKLTHYVDGKHLGHTEGSSVINVVRADQKMMAYGLPIKYDDPWGVFGIPNK